ncbi:MAG: glycoside hydrolase N-terminal domain-containing protein [Candidatus Latescibacteria bacterium]|nr:glycoside hydrolase N-terminal domain-containing protein [Candidatus Latescibacterota bacterium]
MPKGKILVPEIPALCRAAAHPILRDRPSVNFFEGALLGNGGLGAVVCVRPDAVMIHFGHNSVWDIRLAEEHQDQIGTFAEIFARVKAIPAELKLLTDDAWYAQYLEVVQQNYRAPYPRPFPCGTLVLGFDRRHAESIGYRLDIASGLCEVDFLVGGARQTLQLFTQMQADRLWLRMVDAAGQPVVGPFFRVRLLPDPDTPGDLPRYTVAPPAPDTLAFRQVLPAFPAKEDGASGPHPGDRAFSLGVRLATPLGISERTNVDGVPLAMGPLERQLLGAQTFVAVVCLDHGLATAVPEAPVLPAPDAAGFGAAAAAAKECWADFWSKSAVALDDVVLERTWYHNLYFLNCAAKPEALCPGLFANWSYRHIGTAWHGDYHMNYNTQQPFWVAFSANHVDKHEAYVNMVHQVWPLSRSWAKNYYEMAGAFFPHSLYPVEMTINPYPVPTWGWEVFETPWTVQSLWWHYLYTQDRDCLEKRLFGPLKDAVLFMVDYLRRSEAHGPQWGDDRFHIFPTVPPELYGLMPGFKMNADGLIDLTLTRFIFKAFAEACRVLGREEEERETLGRINTILAHYPEYPTAESPRGWVFVSVAKEDPEIVYNVPATTVTIFPGEEHGLHSPPEEYQLALNSYRQQQNEGGNELVFLNLQAARLGVLDLERFKRQIRYCLLPNGTCTDLALQARGRYDDTTPFDFMAPMGIWFENFSLPVVINECLLQSYTGILRLVPNWPAGKAAAFRTLRAVGAFLVSAQQVHGVVQGLTIHSEQGGTCRLYHPWPGTTVRVRDERGRAMAVASEGEVVSFTTEPGTTYLVEHQA